MSAVPDLAPRLWTAEDMLELQREGFRHELFRGELREMPLPGVEHGQIAATLAARATVYAEDYDLGLGFTTGTGFLLERGPDTVRGADWSFVRKERLPEALPKGYLAFAPDIALEVRIPSSRPGEIAEKIAFWLEKGTRVVWDLDPGARTLTIHRADEPPVVLTAAATLTEEKLLPGFAVPVSRIFR